MSEQKNPQEMFDEKIETIEKIMEHKTDFTQTYGNKGSDMIIAAFDIMRVQFSAAIQLETLEESAKLAVQEKTEVVEKALKLMLDVALYRPITKIVRHLSLEVTEFAKNWNDQVPQCPNIAQKIAVLSRIVSSQKTMDDTIQITKKLLEKLQREMSRRPVAYELSKHYLESTDFSIKRRNEKQKEVK